MRHSSSTTLFCGVARYGQTSAMFSHRSVCVSLESQWFMLVARLGLGLRSAQGSCRSGTKPSAQLHHQKGFFLKLISADSRAGTTCLFTPPQCFHEAEIQSACKRAGERANPFAIIPGWSAIWAHVSGCSVDHVLGTNTRGGGESEVVGKEESRDGRGARKGAGPS